MKKLTWALRGSLYGAGLIGYVVLCSVMAGILVDGKTYAKDSRTYYDQEKLSHAKRTIEKHQWARDRLDMIKSSCAWILELSDQELWDFVPPPEQIRAINVSHGVGCPFCGEEIFRYGGHYPWITSRDRPFKVKCPVCQREFPENDFVPWNVEGRDGEPESGVDITDRGIGWVDEDENCYYFVAYYVFWQRWMKDIIGGMSGLSQAYLLTGDPLYAHKSAVLMTRLAGDYKRLDYRTQGNHRGTWNVKGRISDYVWSTADDSRIALAYDAIYPIFDQDTELTAFLMEKGINNPRDHIELNMLKVMTHDVFTGYVRANMGAHQLTMCHLAIVLDNNDSSRGYTTEEMRDWLMSGRGRIEDLLWNGFWRDGLGSESSPKYSSSWGSRFYVLADLLPKLGVEIWDNPKLRRMADIGIDMTIAGEFCPSIGDAGGVLGMGPVGWERGIFGTSLHAIQRSQVRQGPGNPGRYLERPVGRLFRRGECRSGRCGSWQ